MENENILTQLNHAQLIGLFRMLVNERFELDKQWNEYIQLFDEHKKWVESYRLNMTILTDDQWNLIADETAMVELLKENMDQAIEEEEKICRQLISDWNHYIQQAEYYLQIAIDPDLKHLKPNFFQRLYRVVTRRRRYEVPYELEAEMLAPYQDTPRDFLDDYNHLVEYIDNSQMLQALSNLYQQARYIVQQMDESQELLEERQKDKEKIESKVQSLYEAYYQWKDAQTTYQTRQNKSQDLEYYVDEPYRDLSIYIEGLIQLDQDQMITDFQSLDKRFVALHHDPLSKEWIEEVQTISQSGEIIRNDLINEPYTRKDLLETLKES